MIFPEAPKIQTFQNLPVRVIWRSTKNQLVRNAEDCVLWTGQKMSNGSGRVILASQRVTLRRYVFALYHGELKRGEFVRNICPNANCLNPAHLKAYSSTGGNDAESQMRKCAELYRANFRINEIARIMNLKRSWTEELLKRARDAKLLLPVEAEGLDLTADEIEYFLRQGYPPELFD